MDELDRLKQEWLQIPEPATVQHNIQEMEKLLSAKSNLAFYKLRKALYLEGCLAIVLLIGALYLLLTAETSGARLALIQLIFLGAPLLAFYYYGLRQIQDALAPQGALKTLLQQSVSYWKRLLFLYFWGGALLLPVFFIAAGMYRIHTVGVERVYVFQGDITTVALRIGVICVVCSILVWLLIRATYGAYVRELEACLKELSAAQDEA